MLLIILVAIAVLIVGIVLVKNDLDFVGICLGLIGAVVALTCAFGWPVSYYDYQQKVYVYQATKQTIEAARTSSISDVERAALTTKIIDINKDLAEAKYDKTRWPWSDTVPDEYANLPYLK